MPGQTPYTLHKLSDKTVDPKQEPYSRNSNSTLSFLPQCLKSRFYRGSQEKSHCKLTQGGKIDFDQLFDFENNGEEL